MSLSSISPAKRAQLMIAAGGAGLLVLSACSSGSQDTDLDSGPDFNAPIQIDEETRTYTETDNIRIEAETAVLPDDSGDPAVPRLQGTIGTQRQSDGTFSVYVVVKDNEPGVQLTSATVTFGQGDAMDLTLLQPADRPEVTAGGEIVYTERIPCSSLPSNEHLEFNVVGHRDNGTTVRMAGEIDTLTVQSGQQKSCAPTLVG